MNEINLIELFSGIGGFSKGIEQAGYKIKSHKFSEIDKHAIANYKYNFKNAEYIGSVTDVRGKRGEADVITFGSPCQDFSLAGKQSGLDGERSVLILQAIRLISEIRPSVFIWENVKGAFSSNDGADFWAILAAFANIGGYRLEWQLLNTSWFLPQNRERIYLIGHLAKRSSRNVFPIESTNKGIIKRATKTPIARAFTAGGNSGGHHSGMTLIKNLQGNDIINTIRGGGRGSLTDKHNWDIVKVQPVLTPNRIKKRQNGRRFKEHGEPAFTLNCQDRHGVAFTKNYVQWDNSGKGYKSQQDRAFYENGNMGTIPSGRTENKVNILLNDTKIRRLTEIECERLQGFPDDWTRFGNYDGEIKEISKTQRYKMCGNAVTVDVVESIVERLDIKAS